MRLLRVISKEQTIKGNQVGEEPSEGTYNSRAGIRVGEITGLRWEDVDLEEGMIEVNRTLVYYSHGGDGCYFSIHTPKTTAGNRLIPMLDDVKEAFL